MTNPIIRLWKLQLSETIFSPTEIDVAKITSLDEISLMLPESVYTTFRTYNSNKVLHLHGHFQRLRDSAKFAGKVIPINEDRIRRILRIAINDSDSTECRIRLAITLVDEPMLYVGIEPLLLLPNELYVNGAQAITVRDTHRENPRAKLTNFIKQSRQLRKDLPRGINEALMVNEAGEILEGLSSNYFAIRNGVVYTASSGILEGITRTIVCEEIQKIGADLKLQPVHISEIGSLDETFITSTSRAVLPIVKIDNNVIGDGNPGLVTRLISEKYSQRVMRELDEI